MVLVGKPGGRNHLEDLGIDGRIVLKCIFKKLGGGVDLLLWLGIRTVDWLV